MAEPRLPASLAAILAAVHNPALRRVLAAFIGFSLAEWASWIAILVYAFGRGGVAETGLAAMVQLAPSALVAPLAASLGDHVRRERALLLAYLAQALAMGLTATALLLGAPGWVVYVAAALAASSITLTRPIQAALFPSVSRTPSELTAANVAAGMVETGSILVGPVLAGLALAVTGAGPVFAASAGLALLGALLVAGIRPVAADGRLAPARVAASALVGEAFAGFGLLLRDPRPRVLLVLLGSAAMLWGALDIMLVVLALEVLAIGEPGVGYLNAALGAGGLIGAMASISLIGRPRLAVPFGIGMVLWAVPLALLGLVPLLAAVLALLAVAGMGQILIDVAGRTLLQRAAPDAMLSRVFGVLEGIHMGSLAVGSIVAPALIGLLGEEFAFVAAGGGLLLLTAVCWRALLQVDAAGVARPRELALLRGIGIFAPLGATAIDRLAANLVPAHAHAGSVIIRQGEPGEHFYIVAGGRVQVSLDGQPVRELGAGDAFGEIALLRKVPRTATVTALDSTDLMALHGRVFVEAVTGQPASLLAAEEVVRARLGPAPPTVEESADART